MRTKHLLLAENDPRDAKLILAALQESSLENKTFVVRDGEEVLDFLHCRGKFAPRAPGHPVAILLDLKMPKVDGLEVLKRVKADEHLKTIPVVVLTSSRETADLVECYEHGANAFVVKPVDFDNFAQTIKQLGVFWTTINEPAPDPTKWGKIDSGKMNRLLI